VFTYIIIEIPEQTLPLRVKPFKDEILSVLFKDPIRTA